VSKHDVHRIQVPESNYTTCKSRGWSGVGGDGGDGGGGKKRERDQESVNRK